MSDSADVTYFAETDARNKKVKFGVKSKDRLRHVYVIGKTGVGKSTLLENMAIQDIQKGEGMAFIDPHGGTAEKLLEYVPEHRIKDVLYFAPFDMEYPVSFNVLQDIGPDKRHLVVNGLMSTFEKIWADAWSARMSYILQYTIIALLEYPGATLLSINRMLSDKDYRKKIVDNITDPSCKSFWVDEFGKYTERFAAEATPAIQNKVGQFTSNPLVRNLIGQPDSSFDIRKMMDEKKIMIINLSKGRVGEGNANLIGAMLITKIYLAAMSRADKSDAELAKLPNFYLYVDEFQSFANKSFADILSEARKYKLSLNIAHQYIEQMEEEVRDAVFGNVGTMVTFRVGAFDAEVLEKEFAPTFTAEDLVNLGFAQIYLKLMIDGVSSSPFSARTLAPIAKPEIRYKDQIIQSSREQFSKPRAEVEENIRKWHEQGIQKDAKPASNKDISHTHEEQTEVRNDNFSRREHKRPETQNQVSPIPQNNRPIAQNEPPKVDPNKIAFMKAAEMLREKEVKEIPKVHEKPQTASLSNLAHEQDRKKVPTKENISSLKDALSQVINNKPKGFQEKPRTEIPPRPRPQETPKVEQKSEYIKQENSPITKPHHTEPRKEERKPEQHEKKETETNPSKNEVPEDVLRKLLTMEDTQ
ncbi:MAG: TraM recognition domain-containing protein [bacterium]